ASMREGGRGEVEQSPLLIRSSKGRNPLRWEPQIPHPIETVNFENPELEGLMGETYSCIKNYYKMVDEMEDMITAMRERDVNEVMERADGEVRRRGISDDSVSSTARDEDESDEKRGGRSKFTMDQGLKERVEEIRRKREGGGRKFSSSSADGESVGGRRMEGTLPDILPGAVGLEGGVRGVLAPSPGRRPFRFDPVNRIGIYQQEWKRLPAPGEKKRLSLRWKIREQLLQRDVPHFSRADADLPAARLRVPHLHHDKDWSPRPYLQ
ncbi:hypothetical protein PMAYCL1PPCAC_28725, partial [Pristionchus mayeri]